MIIIMIKLIKDWWPEIVGTILGTAGGIFLALYLMS